MATIKGPLFSATASGTLGDQITFQPQQNRQIARAKPIQDSPLTTAQATVRNAYAIAQAGVAWANATALIRTGELDTDKHLIMATTPPTHGWSMWLTAKILGKNHATVTAAAVAWAALTGSQRTAWTDAAASLVPPIPAIAQQAPPPTTPPPAPAGYVFFAYAWGLWAAGLLPAAPGATPLDYGTTPPVWAANAVSFSGSSYLQRLTTFTGAANSPRGIISFWTKNAPGYSFQSLITYGDEGIDGGGLGDFYRSASYNKLYVYDAALNAFLMGGNLTTPTNAWFHVIAAWDTTQGATAQRIYIDDVADSRRVGSWTAATILQAFNSCHVGRYVYAGAQYGTLTGDLSELYYAPGQWLDLTDANQRLKFRSSTGKPVDLGASGATPTGTPPMLYLRAGAATYGANSGSGGDMVRVGTFSPAPTSPSD